MPGNLLINDFIHFCEARWWFIEGSVKLKCMFDHVQRQAFKKPTHMAQNEEPWSRLNDRQTFSSMRRTVLYHKEVS